MMKLMAMGLSLLLLVTLPEADAKRLGGGQSLGQQSARVTQRETPPATAPARPAQQDGGAAQAGAPSASPQAVPQPGAARATPPAQPAPAGPAATGAAGRPWSGVLAGVAAGLGLTWLAHALGFGETFGAVLLLILAGLLFMGLLGWALRARRPTLAATAGEPAAQVPLLRDYSPDKVGNDASARPWERSSMSFDASRYADARAGVRIGSALGERSSRWGVPPDFDSAGFLQVARRNFITLQQAWDRADLKTLRSMMTDRMVQEVRAQLAEREAAMGSQPNHTEVVMLDAQLLGIEDLGDVYMASVEYSGMIREDVHAGPSPFREVWNMTKPKDGATGWLVAGVQALQ